MKDDIQRLHDASMAILGRVGMRFHSRDALKILGDHGVKVLDGKAYFEENQVMEWVARAPRTFTIGALNPAHDITLGSGNTFWAKL